MNKVKFYAMLRSREVKAFGTRLYDKQVQGMDAVLQAGAHLSLSHLAHVLAEVYHETGGGMFPIKETVFRGQKNQNPSDEEVIRRLDRAFDRGQLPWVTSRYWSDGFFGRGQIQLTHEFNYKKLGAVLGVGLAHQPQLALDPTISARIAVTGCEDGLFTGKKLSDFDTANGYDHYSARRIVNGLVAQQAHDVSARAADFTKALKAAGYQPHVPFVVTVPDLSPVPSGGSWWARLLGLFRRS